MTQAAHNYPVESDMTSRRIKTLEFYISYFRDVVQSIMGKLHSRKPVDFCFFLQQCNRKKNTKQRRSVCGWNQCDTKYFNDELTCVFVYNKCRSKQKHFPLCKLLLKTTQTLILYFALLIFFFLSSPNSAPVIFWLHCLYCVSNIYLGGRCTCVPQQATQFIKAFAEHARHGAACGDSRWLHRSWR